jgi:ABC-type glutathione transport system ATPase component
MSDDDASAGTNQVDSEDRHNPPRNARVSFRNEEQKSQGESKEIMPECDNSDDEYEYNPPSVPASAQAEEKREEERSFRPSSARRPSLRRLSHRKDHLQVLVRQKRASQIFIQQDLLLEDIPEESISESLHNLLSDSQKEQLRKENKGLHAGNKYFNEIRQHFPQNDNRVEVRLKDFNYRVKVDPRQNKIHTVYNQSVVYEAWTLAKRFLRREPQKKKHTTCVLQNVTLNFEPGKMYLVLGPPQSGKTTLLKAVAGRLSTANGERIEGSLLYNGISLKVRWFRKHFSSNNIMELTHHARTSETCTWKMSLALWDSSTFMHPV